MMFKNLKKRKNFLTRSKEKKGIKYFIRVDENGAFVELKDRKNQALNSLEYRLYNGVDRDILLAIQNSLEKDFFNIEWQNSSDKIYLHKHPKILDLLKSSDSVYTVLEEKIEFDNCMYNLIVEIEDKNDKFVTLQPTVDGNKKFQFLNSEYVLDKAVVKKIKDIGENYVHINEFEISVNKESIEEVLSLLFSNFTNVELDYDDFKVEFKNEKREIKPALIFEKVTEDRELILKISATIGRISAQFFSDYSPSKVALLNELEKSILVFDADFSKVFEVYDKIFKELNSIKRKNRSVRFSENDGEFIIDAQIANEFISTKLNDLIQECELFGSQKLKAYSYNTHKPNLNVKFKDKIDLLDLDDVSVTIADESFSLFEFINLYKKHSYIPLKNGEKSIVDKRYISKLERIFKKDKKKVKISFFDLPEIEELIAKKEQRVFKKSKEFYNGFNRLKKSKSALPKLNGVVLRDYQKSGIRWLKYLYDNGFGGCLADDMGLGKTLQAIALFSFIYPKEKKPSLVVMPRSLLQNWVNEIEKFNPTLTCYTYYSSQRSIDEIKKVNIVLTTYAVVRNDIEKLKEIEFDTIVLDESQNIKNVDSKISKAVMLLNAKHKFALSGTPIENSLFELYSLFRFINSGMFSSLNSFKNDFVVPIQAEADEETARVLRAKISPFVLRRVKSDVLKELPPKQEQIIYVDMDKSHREFYEEKKRYYKEIITKQIQIDGIANSRFALMQAFNDLRQIASAPELKSENSITSSKIDQLFEMLEDIVLNNHKVLIFANFLGTLDLISAKADEMGYEHLVMSGSTKNRQELVDRFQNDKNIKLFLMTLKVGGVGLNLTSADYVFIFDPWWNRAAESQAIDRVYRIGQKNRVFSYRMITKDTIEEKILKLQEQKQNLSDMVMGNDFSGLKELSEDDIRYILS